MPGRKAVLAKATLAVGAATLATWGGLSAAQASTAGPQHITIETAGVGSFQPNGYFKETVRFTHSSYTIASGGTITFERARRT